jgi:membrane dipeptidase
MRQGGLAAQGFGIVTLPLPGWDCRETARRILATAERVFRQNAAIIGLARSAADLMAINQSGRLAGFLGIEGAHALHGDLDLLPHFFEQGVAYLTLTHFSSNQLAACATDRRPKFFGLSPLGKEAVAIMNRLGMVIDCAHLHPSCFEDVAAATSKPLIVSHGGAKGVNPMWRNLSDNEIRLIAASGGCIGIIFSPWFLTGRFRSSLQAVVDHIDYICALVGDDHVALGSDFDGFIPTPFDLRDITALPRLTQALLERGYARESIRKILGDNFLRVWQANRS